MRQIYEIWPSYEDDRPVIDFDIPDNSAHDWLAVGKVLSGLLPKEDFPMDIAVTVPASDAANWDCYLVAGTSGLFSRKFLGSAAREGLRDFTPLPAKINGTPFYFLRNERAIDCFDRRASRFTTYSPDSARIMQIQHFAFTSSLPEDARLFQIPETLQLLATEAMARKISESDVRGVQLEPLP